MSDDAIAAVERHPSVRRARLVGSRAAGTPAPLSDWDFAVETDDFRAVAADMATLVAPLRPLAQQWDPISSSWCWMAILRGPCKLDFIFAERHQPVPPWQPAPVNLGAIDCHFWDWMLWLTAKHASGKRELVSLELAKLWRHLLSPMGVTSPPASLADALAGYLTTRNRLERSFEMSVDRSLQDEVLPAIGNS